MKRFGLLSAALVLAACGGDDDPKSKGSGGSGGSSGASGSGGSGGTAPADTTPPSFQGVSTATAMGDDSIALTWDAASDDLSTTGQISYRVYAAIGTDPIDYASARVVTPSGATGATLTGLRAGLQYTVAVRAVDAAGNADSNPATQSASLGDTSAPVFGGITGLAQLSASTLLVQWRPASDNGDLPGTLVYRVFLSDDPTSFDLQNPTYVSPKGATLATLKGVPGGKKLYAMVRSVDSFGNTDANSKVLSATTPEGEAPTFAGLASVTAASSTSVTLSWAPAVDNITAAQSIVYRVYQSNAAGGETFTAPSYTVATGDTAYTVTGLTPGSAYYFVVRAVDAVGNEDRNSVEKSIALPPPDTTAPTSGGPPVLTGDSPSSVRLTWPASADDLTPASALRYEVRIGSTPGAAATSPPVVTTAPGVRSFLLTQLAPSTTRYAVVRAVDQAGNVDANTDEASGASLVNPSADTTAPTFTGPVFIQQVASDAAQLLVSWTAGSDDTYAASDLRYHVCVGTSASDCQGTAFYDGLGASSDWGASAVFVGGLQPRMQYALFVRAEDRSGNVSDVGVSSSGATATSFSANVLPFLQTRCNGCHTFTYGTLVNVGSSFTLPDATRLAQVEPGDLTKSYVYRKIVPKGSTAAPFSAGSPNTFGGTVMPSAGALLQANEIDIIGSWITQGAFDN